jgi:hypothetical protein
VKQASSPQTLKVHEICHQLNKLGTTDWALGTFRLGIADLKSKISVLMKNAK